MVAHFWIRVVNEEACAPSNEEMLGNDIQEELISLMENSPSYKRRLISKVFGAQATTNYALMGPWALANYMVKLVGLNFNITNICYISFIC